MPQMQHAAESVKLQFQSITTVPAPPFSSDLTLLHQNGFIPSRKPRLLILENSS
jgi:hypothetical protein